MTDFSLIVWMDVREIRVAYGGDFLRGSESYILLYTNQRYIAWTLLWSLWTTCNACTQIGMRDRRQEDNVDENYLVECEEGQGLGHSTHHSDLSPLRWSQSHPRERDGGNLSAINVFKWLWINFGGNARILMRCGQRMGDIFMHRPYVIINLYLS